MDLPGMDHLYCERLHVVASNWGILMKMQWMQGMAYICFDTLWFSSLLKPARGYGEHRRLPSSTGKLRLNADSGRRLKIYNKIYLLTFSFWQNCKTNWGSEVEWTPRCWNWMCPNPCSAGVPCFDPACGGLACLFTGNEWIDRMGLFVVAMLVHTECLLPYLPFRAGTAERGNWESRLHRQDRNRNGCGSLGVLQGREIRPGLQEPQLG